MIASPHPRPRRRRPPTRGLLFGAPLDRVPTDEPSRTRGSTAAARPGTPVPVALIGEHTPVAPPPVTGFGAMAATWPLVERVVAPTWVPTPTGPEGQDRDDTASLRAPTHGGLSGSEWHRMLGR